MSKRIIWAGILLLVTSTPALASGGGISASPSNYLIWGSFIGIAYLAASFAEKIGQAGVVGALIAGVILAAFDGILSIPDMAIIATIGMAALLFEAGLESDLDAMKKELGPSIKVAVTGVVLPGIAGTLYALYVLNISSLAEIGTFAVALTATSVGISLQVLKQLDLHESREAMIIIGAAVLDDILGMAGLAALSGIAAAGVVSALGLWDIAFVLGVPILVGLAFIGGFIFIGGFVNKVIPGEKRSLAIAALFTTIALALASHLGIAIIIATFVAGAVIKAEGSLHKAVEGIGLLLYAPAFLAVGLLMDWSVMSWNVVPHIIALSALAFITKFVAGYTVTNNDPNNPLNQPLIGAAMASRGEVGLAVVSIAKANGWIASESFAILTGTIILVTIAAPFAMKACMLREANDSDVRIVT